MDLEDLWTPVSPRTLREVVDRLCEAGHVVADAPVDDRRVITGVCQDSRRVRPGDLYAALPGRRHHGADFASEASARGAVAMLSDRPSDIVPTVVVDDPRVALGPLAAWAYGNPSTAFDLYGVTGRTARPAPSTCSRPLSWRRVSGRGWSPVSRCGDRHGPARDADHAGSV